MLFRNRVLTEIKMKQLTLFLLSIVFLCSCTEEYNLNLHPETKLVIDAEITNGRPPYYTHLGMSATIESDLNQRVDDALVIISDDEGVVDTLIPAFDSVWCHHTIYKAQSGEDSIVWYPIYDNIGVIDSSLVYDYRLANRCYYQTTKLQGKAGHTYYLKVEWRGHTYTSECTMPSAIKIDTITYREADKFTDGAVGEIPYVWFHDNPNEDNYYVLKKGWEEEPLPYSNDQYTWSVNIVSDEFLQPGFKGMDLCGGFLTEDGKVIRFPMKSRSSHGINYTGEIPDGTFAMYHTHWDKPGKTIWINNVGQRVDNSSNLSDLVNARQVTTSRYHGDWDYMPFDSFVINRYDCSFNIGGTTTISIINDVFSRHFLFPFLMK